MNDTVALLLGGFIVIDGDGHPAKYNQIMDYIWSSKVHYSFAVTDLHANGELIMSVDGDQPYWLEKIGIWIAYWKEVFGM